MNTGDLEFSKTSFSGTTRPQKLLIFIFIIFIAIIGGVFFLDYYINTLTVQISDLKREQQEYQKVLPSEKEAEIINFEKKLNILNKLLENHSSLSRLLTSLEDLTHPEVYYTSFNFSKENGLVQLEGAAKSQEALIQAINGFINHPREIKAVIVREIKTDLKEKVVNFSINIYFQPEVLKFQPASP